MTSQVTSCATAAIVVATCPVQQAFYLTNELHNNQFMLGKYRKFQSYCWAGIAQSVQRLATGRTVRGSNPGGGEIFRTRPDRLWGPPSLLYNGYRLSFPGVKRPGRGVNHPPPSSAEVKGRVELHIYTPSGPCMPCCRVNLTFTLRKCFVSPFRYRGL
jgi:hypothetical protein